MSYEINVFCIDCRETIANSGGSADLKTLLMAIEKAVDYGRLNIRKILREDFGMNNTKADALLDNLIQTTEIIKLIKCSKEHDLVYERV